MFCSLLESVASAWMHLNPMTNQHASDVMVLELLSFSIIMIDSFKSSTPGKDVLSSCLSLPAAALAIHDLLTVFSPA